MTAGAILQTVFFQAALILIRSKETAAEQFHLVARKLDKIAATSTMHKRTASRKKSRLAKRLNALKAQKGSS